MDSERLKQIVEGNVGVSAGPCADIGLDEIQQMARELRALRWTPITPECLPKVGDEAGFPDIASGGFIVVSVRKLMGEWDFGAWEEEGYTHFRSLNPPEPEA